MLKRKTQFLTGFIGIFIFFVFFSSADSQDFSQIQIKTAGLSEGVFMLEGAGGNCSVSIGKDGVLLIDSQFAQLSDKIKAVIRENGGDKIRLLLNTNWHYDHVSGNEVYGKEGAVIIAHEKTRDRMIAEQFHPDFDMKIPPYPPEALPVITVLESLTVFFNGHEISIKYYPMAHSDADLTFFFKDINVLHAGDLFFTEGYPYIDWPSGGSIDGMIKTTEQLLKIVDDNTKIIPGHGKMGNKAVMKKVLRMMITVRNRIKNLIDQGKTLEDVVASKPTADWDAEFANGLPADFFVTIVYKDLSRNPS